MPRNKIWALDLSYLPKHQDQQPILGVIDYGTRAGLALRQLQTKGSIMILRVLLDLVERCGQPVTLQTDNEAIFTSRLFQLGLWILGIRHQRTAPFAPWQNGRIKRLFGTFKPLWRMRGAISSNLQLDLDLFRTWYNHIRPHLHGGRTPARDVQKLEVEKRLID